MGAADEMEYRLDCNDTTGRPRDLVVRLADGPAIAVTTPPPGTALVALDDAQRLIDAVASMLAIGLAVRRRTE